MLVLCGSLCSLSSRTRLAPLLLELSTRVSSNTNDSFLYIYIDNIQDSRSVHLCEAVMGSWPREGAAQRLLGPSPGPGTGPEDIPAARNNHKGDVRAQGGVREVRGD